MLSRQFRELVDLLRTMGGSIRQLNNSAEDQGRAINAASVSQQEAGSRIERQIAEMRSDDEYKRGANTYKHKAYWQQIVLNCLTGLLAIFTLGAFAAAGIYACIAKKQLDQMIEATKQTKRSADTAACALRENQRQFDLTSKSSQLQFDKTLEQMKGQTTAAQTAGAIAQKALAVKASQFRSENGVPTVSVDPWVAWYYQSASHNCAVGNVCTQLLIHNTAEKTEATNLKIAVKIAIRQTAPEIFPNNWRTPSPSAITYSPPVGTGKYPTCAACSHFLAHQSLRPKAGTLFVWGVVSYYNNAIGPAQFSTFCYQATTAQIFGSGAKGWGDDDARYKCQVGQTQQFPNRYMCVYRLGAPTSREKRARCGAPVGSI
jgi:hypothetical protein